LGRPPEEASFDVLEMRSKDGGEEVERRMVGVREVWILDRTLKVR